MNVEDHDWLDRRLAGDAYIPDNGFTARVIQRVPTGPRRDLVLRRRILSGAGMVAAGLAVAHIIALVPSLEHALAGHSLDGFANAVSFYARQTPVQVGAAMVMTALAGASVSLSRRLM